MVSIHVLLTLVSAFMPTTSVGPFEVLGCEDPSIDRLSDVREVVHDIVLGAAQAADDAKLGTDSLYGFTELFKSNANRARVFGVFGQIASGAKVNALNKHGVLVPWTVGFLCPTPGHPLTDPIYKLCVERGMVGYVTKENPLVVLCPKMWDLPFVLPQKKFCPRLDGSEYTSDTWFQYNRFIVVMHKIVHLYSQPWLHPEKFDINDMVALDQSASVMNVNNFAFYASSQFPLYLLMLQGRD